MKKLVNNQDYHVIQGAPVTVQNRMNAMSERYDIIIHACNVGANGDAIVVVERKKKDSQRMMEEINQE